MEDDYNDYYEDEDYDSGMSYSQQCAHDRAEVARERLERGEIDEEQASEIRMGA